MSKLFSLVMIKLIMKHQMIQPLIVQKDIHNTVYFLINNISAKKGCFIHLWGFEVSFEQQKLQKRNSNNNVM